MERSQSIVEITKALIAFQKECPPIPLSADNPFFKSKYADLATIISVTKPVLTKHKLAISQVVEGEGSVTTVLAHESGEFFAGTLSLKPSKDDPQGRGSAITYSRRYAYLGIIGAVGDEDDDGNAATHKAEPKPQVKPDAKAEKGVDLTKAVTDAGKKWDDKEAWKAEIVQFCTKRYGKTQAKDLTEAEKLDLVEFLPKISEGNLMPFDYEPFNKEAK